MGQEGGPLRPADLGRPMKASLSVHIQRGNGDPREKVKEGTQKQGDRDPEAWKSTERDRMTKIQKGIQIWNKRNKCKTDRK